MSPEYERFLNKLKECGKLGNPMPRIEHYEKMLEKRIYHINRRITALEGYEFYPYYQDHHAMIDSYIDTIERYTVEIERLTKPQ